MKEFKEPVDSYRVEGELYCIADEMIELGLEKRKGEEFHSCGSSDGMSHYISEYEDGTETSSSYCFSCAQAFQQKHLSKSSLGEELGLDAEGSIVAEKRVFEKKPKQPRITREQIQEVVSYGYSGNEYRGVKDEYYKFFGHAIKKDSKGNPKVIFYPETKDGKMMGYKSRTLPKTWGYENKGITGIKNDLAGYVKFKERTGRDILIVGGEMDLVSSHQMFEERNKNNKQEDYLPMPIVSPTTGEGSAASQLRQNYDFINGFSNIILGLDNDTAGIAAMEEIAEIFPKDKIKICQWGMGDPNSYLHNKEGKDYSAQFIRDFYNAVPYVSNGIVTSKQADCLIEEELLRPKIALPDFMSDLQKKMAGGEPLGYIVNYIAESGIGKSTLVNEAIRYKIYNSPYKVGIMSLELTAAQYMIAMLSREVGKKINLFENPEDAVAFVRTPEVIAARKHLCEDEYGEERFIILDERDGDLDEVKTQCELLINKHGCQIIIIDPIQDLFEGVSMDQQNSFIKWMKIVLKKGVTFVNVCHVRKGNNSTDKDGKRIMRELTEDDVHGISAIVKSAGANVFMSRNKYAENTIEKNTTFVTLGKCRWSGNTGRVGSWYYDNDSHTMYDLHDYFRDNPDKLNGYDLDYNPFLKTKEQSKTSNNGFSKPKKEDTPVDSFDIDMGDGVKL